MLVIYYEGRDNDDGTDHEKDDVDEGEEDHEHEGKVIGLTDAVVYPDAVMIELINASVAYPTMLAVLLAEGFTVIAV